MVMGKSLEGENFMFALPELGGLLEGSVERPAAGTY